MIITRTPLRVTLGGGGSDLDINGLCITASISVFNYVVVNHIFRDEYILKYSSKVEHAKTITDIEHSIIRECLRVTDTKPGIELVSFGDVDGGSGLGSSGAFTVGTLKALKPEWSNSTCAEMASEIDTGWQDQWACGMGGIRETSDATSHKINRAHKHWNTLNQSLRLWDTGIRHSSDDALLNDRADQDVLRKQAQDSREWLVRGEWKRFAGCLTEQWNTKFVNAPTELHKRINTMVYKALSCGAWGAKLVGAGDGGFILTFSPEPLKLDLKELPFTLVNSGTVVM